MDAFGIDREEISKKIPAKGVRSLWGATEAAGNPSLRLVPSGRSAANISQRMGLKPKPAVKPNHAAAAAGNQATNSARAGMRARANSRRTKIAVGATAGTAAVGSAGVLGYDKATKPKRVSVAA